MDSFALELKLNPMVQNNLSENVEISFSPQRKGEIKNNYSYIDKAKRNLGFTPNILLEQGVPEVCKWFLNKGPKKIKKLRYYLTA